MLDRFQHEIETLRRRAGRWLHQLDGPSLVEAFQRLGLTRGMTVSAHSSMSRIGEVQGGADTMVDALMEVVGSEGCLLMPTFPTGGSMQDLIASEEVYDVRSSPSKVGRVTEVFRNRPDVMRSLHPTNPLAAWGAGADFFLKDHEQSLTPYGHETPYGRMAQRDDSYILMIETHVHSFLHHLQERVDFPTLFLPEMATVPYIDEGGDRHTMTTRVMRPRIPYFIAIPPASGDEPDWAILHDYALMFPKRREQAAKQIGYRFLGHPSLHSRRREFERAGVLRTARIGGGEMGLLHVQGFLARVEPELRELIERYRSYYDADAIAARALPYS